MKENVVRFEKWEGLGNDFILVEAAPMTAEAARRLCDRRFGIGADGVLVIDRERPRMEVWNADGSRPEMCGNGIRCVAAYLVSRGTPQKAISIATDAGDKRCEVSRAGDRFDVVVGMGRARMGEPLAVTALGAEHRFATVDVGNPHAVTFDPYTEEAIDDLGPIVATTPAGGINVEFCRVRPAERGEAACIDVTVWERGVGRTLACGTGACAVAAAACAQGRAPYGAPLRVVLPGGALRITVAAGSLELLMQGPARRAFSGEVVIA
ncbi:diaminopimelate epimerase [Sorangium sp. So ce388]|uniref:diaminopimelate epimerase n=1 Tax=Sorangium sp. So ce388 TaxID=3133309 RepID=UPI003F5BA973